MKPRVEHHHSNQRLKNNSVRPQQKTGASDPILPEITLDRYEKAGQFARPLEGLQTLPHAGVVVPGSLAAEEKNYWATQVGDELVLVSTEHSIVERYQKKEMPTPGLRSLLWKEEETVVGRRHGEEFAISPRGDLRAASYAAAGPSDQEIRTQIMDELEVLTDAFESSSPLVKQLSMQLPFHNAQEAREILFAAPAVPGPIGTAILAGAMLNRLLESNDRSGDRRATIVDAAATQLRHQLKDKDSFGASLLRQALDFEWANKSLILEGAAEVLEFDSEKRPDLDLIEATIINPATWPLSPGIIQACLKDAQLPDSAFDPYQRLYLEKISTLPTEEQGRALNQFPWEGGASGFTASMLKMVHRFEAGTLADLMAPLGEIDSPEASFFKTLSEQDFTIENSRRDPDTERVTVLRATTQATWGDDECARRILFMASKGLQDSEAEHHPAIFTALRTAYPEGAHPEVDQWLEGMEKLSPGPHFGQAGEALSLLQSCLKGAEETEFSPRNAVVFSGHFVEPEALAQVARHCPPKAESGTHAFLYIMKHLAKTDLDDAALGLALSGASKMGWVTAQEPLLANDLALAGALSGVPIEHRPTVKSAVESALAEAGQGAPSERSRLAASADPAGLLERLRKQVLEGEVDIDFQVDEIQVGSIPLAFNAP